MARGQASLSAGVVTTLLGENDRANDKKILTHGLIKNTSTSQAIYAQWTEERDVDGNIVNVTAGNGFPIEAGEALAFELRREGTRVKAPIQVIASGVATLAYVFE